MGTVIDSLEIQISAPAGDASKKLDELIGALNRLGKSTQSSSKGLSSFTFNLAKIGMVAGKVKSMLSGVVSEAIEWDGIQYRFRRSAGKFHQQHPGQGFPKGHAHRLRCSPTEWIFP